GIRPRLPLPTHRWRAPLDGAQEQYPLVCGRRPSAVEPMCECSSGRSMFSGREQSPPIDVNAAPAGETVEALADQPVAFAARGFQTGAIEHGDLTAAVGNQA